MLEHIRYFLQDEKGTIFITNFEGQKKKKSNKKSKKKQQQQNNLRCKAFKQTQASPVTEHALVFLRWEKFLQGSEGERTELPLARSVPTRCTDNDENQILRSNHDVSMAVGGGH